MPELEEYSGPTLSRECCVQALRGKWVKGRIIVCGGCFLPYTAIVDTVPGRPGEVLEVESWWTGLRDA